MSVDFSGAYNDIKGFLGEGKKTLFGDPQAIKDAYDKMMSTASGMTDKTRQFLAGQEGKALGFYQPMQGMFNSMYGMQGIQAPQVPQAQGVRPFSSMYGGR